MNVCIHHLLIAQLKLNLTDIRNVECRAALGKPTKGSNYGENKGYITEARGFITQTREH